MNLDAIPNYGWATAIVALITLIASPIIVYLMGRPERAAAKQREVDNAEHDYEEATATGDHDRAAAAARRLRRMRKRL